MSRVLVIDDEPAVCWSLRELLHQQGHQVETAGSVEQAWERMEGFEADAVVLDVRLPGEDGLSAIPEFRKKFPNAAVIVMTAFGDLRTATSAFSQGVFEYFVKPFDLGQFAATMARALDRQQVPVSVVMGSITDVPLVGHGSLMQAVFRQIALVAPTDFPVLVLGETGTGKDVAARAVHDNSLRASHPFMATSLVALNPALVESELFGHVRGAFTGAIENRKGLFEIAENGTLFLDEIAETPLSVQVKLLRVLETRRYSPMGSAVERIANVRLIAATHRDLPTMIAAGEFREDLYHRLRVFTVTLPALRARREDIRPLAMAFFSQTDEALRPSRVSGEFWDELERRDWRGNVRELKNAIDHAVVLARGQTLEPRHLPVADQVDTTSLTAEAGLTSAISEWVSDEIRHGRGHQLHKRLLLAVERSLFAEVLRANDENRTAAAKALGLDRATLRSRLRDASNDSPRIQ